MKLIIIYWCYFSLFCDKILDFLDGISYTFSVKNGPFQASWIRISIQEDKQTRIWIYSPAFYILQLIHFPVLSVHHIHMCINSIFNYTKKNHSIFTF